MLSQLGFIPSGGESFEFQVYRFTVLEMDRRRIARLKVQKLPEAPILDEQSAAKSHAEAKRGEKSTAAPQRR